MQNEKKFLVVVPHQDDEISVGGAVIPLLREQGLIPHVLFCTNGDYRISAETRLHEAACALHVLGVPREHIHILGYADMLGGSHHIFYSTDNPIISPSGHTETYGTNEFIDYGFLRRHVHSPYTKTAYQKDLKEFILELRPSIIFCMDFDSHADHRMLSLSFDRIMGEILCRKGNTYFPQVFKTLSYALAFYSYLDFWTDNILSTRRPVSGEIETYDVDIIDFSLYTWEDRIRFPVPAICRKRRLRKNLIYNALKEHRSQHAELQAPRIINGDCVYWERRTDSLTYGANIQVSSGCGKHLCDFMLYNITDITSKNFLPQEYLWKPEPDDCKRIARFSWDQSKHVEMVRIWGNISGDVIKKISIRSSNGEQIIYGPLNRNGQKNDFLFKRMQGIKWIEISLLEVTGADIGLAEVEIFPQAEAPSRIKPFIKCMIQDQFIYDYRIRRQVTQLVLSTYQYGIKEEVRFSVEKGQSYLDGSTLRIHPQDQEIIVKAYTSSHIYDRIRIQRVPDIMMRLVQVIRFMDKLDWYLCCRKEYVGSLCKRTRQLGLRCFVKKVFQKVMRWQEVEHETRYRRKQ